MDGRSRVSFAWAGLIAVAAAVAWLGARPAPAQDAGSTFVEDMEEVIEEFFDRAVIQHGIRPRPDLADPLLEQRRILVFGEINNVTAAETVAKLLHLDARGDAAIELLVRTDGGWPDDALAICDAMEMVRGPVNVTAMGACESAGARILAAATGVRRAMPNAMIMVHLTEDPGDEEHSRDRTERERTEAFWRLHARLPEDWFPMEERRTIVLDAEQALRFGIVDEVVSARKRTRRTR